MHDFVLRKVSTAKQLLVVGPASRFREFETLFPTPKLCKTMIQEFKDFSEINENTVILSIFFLQLLVALAIATVVAEPEAEANAGAPLPYFGPPYQPNYYANPKKLVAHPAVPYYGYYGHPYHYGHYLGKSKDTIYTKLALMPELMTTLATPSLV